MKFFLAGQGSQSPCVAATPAPNAVRPPPPCMPRVHSRRGRKCAVRSNTWSRWRTISEIFCDDPYSGLRRRALADKKGGNAVSFRGKGLLAVTVATEKNETPAVVAAPAARAGECAEVWLKTFLLWEGARIDFCEACLRSFAPWAEAAGRLGLAVTWPWYPSSGSAPAEHTVGDVESVA